MDSSTSRLARLWFALASAGVLSIILPIGLLSGVPDTGRSIAWVLTLALMVFSGGRLSLIAASGHPRLFDFFFHLYVYIFMGVGATAQLRSGQIASTTQGIDSGLDLPTAEVIVGGVVVYEVARALTLAYERRRRAGHRSGAGASPQPRPRVGVSAARSVALYAVGLAFAGYYAAKVGVSGAFGSREYTRQLTAVLWPDPAIRAVIRALATYPLLVAIGCLLQVRRRVGGRSPLLSAVVLVGVIALLPVANPIGTSRYAFGTVAFALLVYAGACGSRVLARVTMFGTILGFLFLFPLADAFRRNQVNFSRDGFFGEYLGNADYDSFWQVANALSYWVDGLVVAANQLLGSLLFWVPRAIWPDKPTDTGIMLAQYRGYEFQNLSAPVWAELLVNGGLIAVAIGFAVLGVALRRLDSVVLPAFRLGGLWAIVGAIFPVYMTILMRGSLLQATGSVFVAVGCLVVVRSSERNPWLAPQP